MTQPLKSLGPVDPGVVCVAVSSIIDENRQRKDYGDVADLARSIKQFGLIQPIIIQPDARLSGGASITHPQPILVAGGRRLRAIKSIGIELLRYGIDFVWRDEDVQSPDRVLRFQAVELEENIRRKDLSWSEAILAKQRLFDLMQTIHGASRGFATGRHAAEGDGFSLRKLAAMLGENPGTTTRDLQLAGFVAKHPILATLPTKSDAQRKLGVAITVAGMQANAKRSTVSPAQPSGGGEAAAVDGSPTKPLGVGQVGDPVTNPASPNQASSTNLDQAKPAEPKWVLHEGDFQKSIVLVPDQTVDLVLTDLPYNIGLGTATAAHSGGLGQFKDDNLDIATLCQDVARESYRVLRPNRFAVFFYGMNYHKELYDSLVTAGFSVDPYPFIWLRDRTAPPDGFARYSKSYDPAFVASKQSPRFIRPNLANSIAVASVRGAERLHAAQKPVAIMQKFIEDMTIADCIVLDMFAGAGTTGEAALRTGRKAILFEREPHNCLLIKARLGSLGVGQP